jgi:hypothetical protein
MSRESSAIIVALEIVINGRDGGTGISEEIYIYDCSCSVILKNRKVYMNGCFNCGKLYSLMT